MFDIGFSEMVVCAIVALVVIGPEKLPRVARTLGHLFGRLQRYVAQVKSDIHREMEAADLGKVKTEFEDAARSFQSDVESSARETEREVREMQASLDRDIADAASALDPAKEEAKALEKEPERPASPQLELGIAEPEAQAPPKKQASA
jgi:sec-independent protein translocase protein TatB